MIQLPRRLHSLWQGYVAAVPFQENGMLPEPRFVGRLDGDPGVYTTYVSIDSLLNNSRTPLNRQYEDTMTLG
jgi:hypothetical protein